MLVIWEQEHKRNLHIIHTKNSPKYKLSNEASCLAPNRTTKNSKKIQVWERGSCVVCVERSTYTPIFIHVEVILVHGKIGNYPIPPQHAAMQPSEQRWAEPHWGWCSPCWPASPLPCAGGLLAGLGGLPCWCSAQICKVGGLLSLFLFYALSESVFLSPFPPYSFICPVK
jgi:hypothetical protein